MVGGLLSRESSTCSGSAETDVKASVRASLSFAAEVQAFKETFLRSGRAKTAATKLGPPVSKIFRTSPRRRSGDGCARI